MRIIISTLLFLILMAGSPFAATHAIIVGIDNYSNHPRLLGAVNDARDLEKTLKPKVDGVFQVLIDEYATRANFDKAWNQILDSAKANDLLIFSFSGHGVTRPDDDVFRDEADGLDELLLFQPFDERVDSGFSDEYLLDDELFELFKQADKKNIKILFIADACHSGGLSRAVGDLEISQAGLPYRFTKLGGKLASSKRDFQTIVKKPEIPGNVVFLSATNERMRLQEMLLGGKPRGALSYFVARAIEGKANANNDDVITAGELKNFVIGNVRAVASQRQIPEMIVGDISQRLITVERRASKIKPAPNIPQSNDPRIRLHVRNMDQQKIVIDGAVYVDTVAGAELIFDVSKGRLFNVSGDMLAETMSFATLPAAVKSMRVRKSLIANMGEGHLLDVILNPDDRLYTANCEVRFQVKDFNYRHFTVVNLAANGQLQFLFPIKSSGFNDPVLWNSKDTWKIDNRVSEPYGADFLIFIASEHSLAELHTQLGLFGATMTPERFLKLFSKGIKNQKYQIGLKGVYTSRKGSPC